MRLTFTFLLLSVFAICSGSLAAQDARRQEIAAANSRALDSLFAQVAAESIGDHLTVGDLVRQTRSSKKVMQILARAQQIGGPRWLDERTCEVRLDIPGPQVARVLVEIATLDNRTPVPADVLAVRLRKWDNRTFSSTGAASVDLSQFDAPKQQACKRARQDATNQVLERILPIPLADGKTVADAMAKPAVADPVNAWLDSRPITRVEFRDSDQARVSLAVSGDELFNVFRSSAEQDPSSTGAMDSAGWSRVHDEFIARVSSVAGRAIGDESTKPKQPAFSLPRTPPQWVERTLDAEGTAPKGPSQLRAARSAEEAAVEKLRAQLNPLEITDKLTLGQVVEQDARVSAALDRALARAQKSNIEYLPDGGARVTVRLDLQSLWDELQAPR